MNGWIWDKYLLSRSHLPFWATQDKKKSFMQVQDTQYVLTHWSGPFSAAAFDSVDTNFTS